MKPKQTIKLVDEIKSGVSNKSYFEYIMAFFVALLLISNIASTKILLLGPFTFDGGTILFPLTYIFSDILTEVYGYSKARTVVWTGFFCAILMNVVFAMILLMLN